MYKEQSIILIFILFVNVIMYKVFLRK